MLKRKKKQIMQNRGTAIVAEFMEKCSLCPSMFAEKQQADDGYANGMKALNHHAGKKLNSFYNWSNNQEIAK